MYVDIYMLFAGPHCGNQSTIMAGSGARWNLLYIVSFLAVGATIAVDSGNFSGGTMSFYFSDTSNKDTYKVGSPLS